MAAPRILLDEPIGVGASITLDEARAHHITAVLRLDVGDEVRVFNARDGEWRAKVAARSKRGVSLTVETFLRPSRAVPDLDLLFAPVKRHATDLIVEKATELGVRRIRPVITQRTIAETVRLDRLNVIGREAAEQTERFEAPELSEPVSLAKALDGWDAARRLIYCDEGGDAAGMLMVMQGMRPSPNAGGEALALLIGPEGGFTPQERAMLRALSFVTPVTLGPRILRAETAAIAALSIIQAAWGDWNQA